MNLSPVRTAKLLYTLGSLVRDPNKLDKVFEMADAVSTPAQLQPMADHVAREPEGKRALAERARLHIDLRELGALPAGTLGHAFAAHMIANGLDPAAIPTLPSPDTLSFVRAHLYETHDVWHVVTGFATDWKSELGLQAFYLAQIPGPLPAALLAVGCLRVAGYEMSAREELMEAIARGWAMGKRARPLFGVRWNELWSKPLAEVQRQLGITSSVSVARAA